MIISKIYHIHVYMDTRWTLHEERLQGLNINIIDISYVYL